MQCCRTVAVFKGFRVVYSISVSALQHFKKLGSLGLYDLKVLPRTGPTLAKRTGLTLSACST